MAAPVASARHVEINGASLYVEEHGAGTPLVLMHPGFLNSTMWAATLPVLARHVRVITFDKRGHGRSTNPAGELSLRRIADDTAALIGALELDRPFVGGWSNGGVIALAVGVHYPVLARGLIVGAAPIDWHHDAVTLTSLRDYTHADQTGMIDFDTVERESPDFVTWLRSMHPQSADQWQGIVQQTLTMWHEQPSLTQEQIEQITTPALVICGDRDDVVPLDQIWTLYQWLPNAELAVLPGCDHARPVDEPATFVAAVVDFIERHRDNGSQTADHHAS